ncbi:hypothetical protein DPEC_G00154100 [Dallia pectoralis]|uniref:Uncharacterized protein n=1 Tax=Dallia pectoralis TaxID=75939 RepID=A0ACC2GK42_DALPE|nr:hypothetical protein DPEC_G00154100 [Dallia pectoralis]
MSLQKHLREKHQICQKTIQEREKEIQELRKTVDSVKELIRAQEKAEVSWVEGLLDQLEQEVSEMRRRDVELKQLSHTEDHIHFLQSFQSLCVSPGSEVLSSNPHISFEHVKKSIFDLKYELEDVCKKEIHTFSGKVTTVQIGPPAEPKTREDFLSYTCQLTLDPNTAYQNLCLSEGNRKVTWSDKVQSYTDHPDKFNSYKQVLCREGLSGVCYWEVEWSGEKVSVAVSYKGISRKGHGDECVFGFNGQSWRLFCTTSSGRYYHNKNRTDIMVPCSSRVGVYLDHRAGTLSFYSVSDTMTLLHRVQTTFTQPLYPGLYVNMGTSVKILTPIQ